MKILVYFKHLQLGDLSLSEGKLVYNSNLEQEKIFEENFVSASFYPLFQSVNLHLKELPDFLQKIYLSSENEIVASHAKLKKTDDTFTKLYKLSCLDFDDMGFYIKAK